jgi:hypothetical protein
VHGLEPRVAVMNNGTRKGGSPEAFAVLHAAPGLEDLWQLHWSYNARLDNSPALFIANIDDDATVADVLTAEPAAGGARGGFGGGPGRGGPGGGAPGAGGPGGGGVPGAGGPGAVPGGAPGGGARGGFGGGGGGFGGGRGGFGGGAGAHEPAFLIHVSADADGSFTVTNARNGFSKTYDARP